MAKKKQKIITLTEVAELIKEIKTKYEPDFLTVDADPEGDPKEIQIMFGWRIEQKSKRGG